MNRFIVICNNDLCYFFYPFSVCCLVFQNMLPLWIILVNMLASLNGFGKYHSRKKHDTTSQVDEVNFGNNETTLEEKTVLL